MNGLCQLALKVDISEGGGSTYVHPTTKQCNYVYTHPTTKQCNYSISIINNLTSSSTTAALSANQGRLLNQKIAELETKIEDSAAPTVVDSGSIADGEIYHSSLPYTISVSSCDYIEIKLIRNTGYVNEGTVAKGSTLHLYTENMYADLYFSLNSAGTGLTIDAFRHSDTDYRANIPAFSWVAYG